MSQIAAGFLNFQIIVVERSLLQAMAFNLKQEHCPCSSHDDHHGRPSDLILKHSAIWQAGQLPRLNPRLHQAAGLY